MNDYQVTDKLVKLLNDLANKKTAEEYAEQEGQEFDLYKRTDGIVYNGYQMGTEDGEIYLARTILLHLENKQ